jgi:hypothetical protein
LDGAPESQPDPSLNRSTDLAPAALSRATLWPFAVSVLLPGVVLVAILVATPFGRSLISSMVDLARSPRTVDDRLAEFGAPARERWRERLSPIGVAYPPPEVALVALKDERRVEVYVPGPAASADASRPAWRFVASYPILAASGAVGPKLREGDLQVPEGMYRVEALNPNSRFHASLRLDYPNEFDRSMASRDGRGESRTPLGGDIMLHGGDRSVGCIAIGDPAIEELFTLVADAGIDGARVVIAPWDLRVRPWPEAAAVAPPADAWATELYRAIDRVLAQFPRPQ